MNGRVLVTGGAGFIGSNLVSHLLEEGLDVTIFDTFSRRGTHANVAWLSNKYKGSKLRVVRGDVRNFRAVQAVVQDADVIYHLAGQVAVTTSVADPRSDFEINALGTFNVLEAARLTGRQPVIVFSSTNKVYGGMEHNAVEEQADRFYFRDLIDGVSEKQLLDFHSPYGCSKGAADQYVRDYARIFGLPTVVFRMSCIYGPRQFGTEEQGWVAHFIISALTGRPITIYGNGKQVRDVLFVDDLVCALRLAVEKIDRIAGEVFNIGGGRLNALSVWNEFGRILAPFLNEAPNVSFDNWRPGDQPCYISDIRKASELLGWKPLIDKETGIRRLGEWVSAHMALFTPTGAGKELASVATTVPA
jgi:CDP-paratose 2-epimerase